MPVAKDPIERFQQMVDSGLIDQDGNYIGHKKSLPLLKSKKLPELCGTIECPCKGKHIIQKP